VRVLSCLLIGLDCWGEMSSDSEGKEAPLEVKPTAEMAMMLRGSVWGSVRRRVPQLRISPCMIEREAKKLNKIARLSEASEWPCYPKTDDETRFAASIMGLPAQESMEDVPRPIQITRSSTPSIIDQTGGARTAGKSDLLQRSLNNVQQREAYFDQVVLDSSDALLKSVEDDVFHCIRSEKEAYQRSFMEEGDGRKYSSYISSSSCIQHSVFADDDLTMSEDAFQCPPEVLSFYQEHVEKFASDSSLSRKDAAQSLSKEYAEDLGSTWDEDAGSDMQKAWSIVHEVAVAKSRKLSARFGVRQALEKQFAKNFDPLQPETCRDFVQFNALTEKLLKKTPEEMQSRVERQHVCDTDMCVWACLFFALRSGFRHIAHGIAEHLRQSAASSNVALWVDSVISDSGEDPVRHPVPKSEFHCRDPFKLLIIQLTVGSECKTLADPRDKYWSLLATGRVQPSDDPNERHEGISPFLIMLFGTQFEKALNYLWENGQRVEAVHFGLVLVAVGELPLTRQPSSASDVSYRDVFVQILTEDGSQKVEMNYAEMLLRYLRRCLIVPSADRSVNTKRLRLCVSYIRMLAGDASVRQNLLTSVIVSALTREVVTPEECFALSRTRPFGALYPADKWEDVLNELRQRHQFKLWLSLKQQLNADSLEERQAFVAEELKDVLNQPESEAFKALVEAAHALIERERERLRLSEQQEGSHAAQKLNHLLGIARFYGEYRRCDSESDAECFRACLVASAWLFAKDANGRYVVSLPHDQTLMNELFPQVAAALVTLTQCMCRSYLIFECCPALALCTDSEEEKNACIALHQQVFAALHNYARLLDSVRPELPSFTRIVESQMKFIRQASALSDAAASSQ